MLCVTNRDERASETEARFRALPSVLHEVRLDLSREVEAHLRLLGRWARKISVLVTCRPSWEGGGFLGPEGVRARWLERALRAGVRYLDLELEALGGPVRSVAKSAGPERLLVSAHRYSELAPQELVALAHRLGEVPAAQVKIAARVGDVADLGAWSGLSDQVRGRKLVAVPMGRAGLVGRIRYQDLGSTWTYVAYDRVTAQGQVSWDLASLYGAGRDLKLLVLLGGENVFRSPGPGAYNEWFRTQGLSWQYLPAVTARPAAALSVLRELFGLSGASVTMPHKEAAAQVCVHLDGPAQALGAVNTVTWTPGGWAGRNTDTVGVSWALAPAGPLRGRALVLGAGGAAAAAVWALREAGCNVAISNRTEVRGRALAERLGVRWIPWEDRCGHEADVLVNATPLGQGRENPMPCPSILRDAVVLDMVLSERKTPLLVQAEASGARFAASGLDMWVGQGREQMAHWTGRAPDAAWLRQAAQGAVEALRVPDEE